VHSINKEQMFFPSAFSSFTDVLCGFLHVHCLPHMSEVSMSELQPWHHLQQSLFTVQQGFVVQRQKVKISLWQATEAHKGCETLRFPHFLDNQITAVRLSALCTGHPLPPGRFLVLISVRGWINPGTTVELEALGQLKNPMTSSGIEPMTFRLGAQCLNQLHCVPQDLQQGVSTHWCSLTKKKVCCGEIRWLTGPCIGKFVILLHNSWMAREPIMHMKTFILCQHNPLCFIFIAPVISQK
jgi:hypothetical protein